MRSILADHPGGPATGEPVTLDDRVINIYLAELFRQEVFLSTKATKSA